MLIFYVYIDRTVKSNIRNLSIPHALVGMLAHGTPFKGEHEAREPSLRAYRIALQDDSPVIRFRLTDVEGQVMSRGRRQIQVVNSSSALVVCLIFAFVPPAALAAVRLLRNLRYK